MDCEEFYNYTKYSKERGNDVAYLESKQQRFLLALKEKECTCRMQSEPVTLTGTYCNRTWDNVMCWGDTPAGTTVSQPCPAYINYFQKYNFATRICLENGTWFSLPRSDGSVNSKGWTNFTECPNNITESKEEITNDVPHIFSKHVSDMRVMYNVGYAVSLVSLLVAFTIMVYFKKLRCSRNSIHLNLFASFMLRASISLIRENCMVGGLGFPKDVTYNETGGIIVFKEGPHWECRLFFSIFQYAVASSYIWIFVEAVYLHMYIFVSLFTDKIKARWFILFGWCFPGIIIVCLCIARYHLDNSFCWNTYNKKELVWIFKGPIVVTILLNFIFFINIVRVLYTKLQAPNCLDSKRTKYRRLARSTFFLVPTFGVYFLIFTTPLNTLNDTMNFVMLFIEMFFNSFQGLFIAVVLCFINLEVREEIKRSWHQGTIFPCNRFFSGLTKTGTKIDSTRRYRGETVDSFVELEELNKRQDLGRNGDANKLNTPFLEET